VIADRRADPASVGLTERMIAGPSEILVLADGSTPEHLEVSSREPHRWELLLKHAGAIFLDTYTSKSLGD